MSSSIVTLLCDSGDRYANTCYDDEWLAGQGIDLAAYDTVLDRLLGTASG